MTLEELEIIVTAKVEDALKELEKFLPAIRGKVKQAEEAFQKVDTKKVTKKLQQTVNFMKKKMQDFKKTSENNEIAIKVNNKDAKKQITQLEKEIDSLQKKINARKLRLDFVKQSANQMYNNNRSDGGVKDNLGENSKYIKLCEQEKELNNEIQVYNKLLENAKSKMIQLKQETSQVAIAQNKLSNFKINDKDAEKQIAQIQKQIDDLQKKISTKQLKLDFVRQSANQMYNNNNNNDGSVKENLGENTKYIKLSKQEKELNSEIQIYKKMLESAKSKMAELKQQTSQTATTQNRLSSFFSAFKQKIEQVKPSIIGIKNGFKGMPQITQSITNSVKNMEKSVKVGLGHILKYAGALFSMQGIYSTLRSCAHSWLASQNSEAKQLNANIEYMKYAMGSALAPVIQFVTNCVYQLLKAVQSVVYALFKVNIFAKASASAFKNAQKQAKNTSKQLASVHNEINNVADHDNGNPSPNIGDMSTLDSQMSPLAQKMYDFFKPLVDSWNKYGYQVKDAFKNAINGIGQAISAMWSSLETLFTNGTIYSIIANILNSIGKIGVAWANAWNNDDNGTEIIQGIANMINDITNAILNLVSSTGFQNFLDGVLSAFSGIVQLIEPIISGFSDIAEKILEIVFSTIGDVLKNIGDALQAIAQNETAVEILKSIGEAIAIVVTAYTIWSTVTGVLTAMQTALDIALLPLIGIILAIIAVITAIVLVIMNWGDISKWLSDTWEWIKQKATEIFTAIGEFFKNIFNSIKDFFVNIWNSIKEFFINLCISIYLKQQEIWNNIKNCISNIINAIKTTISNVLNGIKNIWNNCWNGLKNIVTSIFNGIWNTIKKVINSILGGIEGMANGVVNGVNLVIRTLNKLKFTIPDWVPGLGGRTFGFNLNEMNKITLPRLAKGNVA